MLWGCTPAKTAEQGPINPNEPTTPDAPATPDEPVTPIEPENPVAELPAGSGIDWNKTISGGGKLTRSADDESVYYIVSFNPPYDMEDLSYNDNDSFVTIYKPVFSCFASDAVNDAVNAIIEQETADYISDSNEAFSVTNDVENGLYYRKNGWASFYVEIVGNYINISFERMINCYSYVLDESEYEEFVESVAFEYTTNNYCLDLKTGKRLTIEDIFYSDCDLGKLLGVAIASSLDSWDNSLKRPFRGLPEKWTDFSLTSGGELIIRFPESNPYTTAGASIAIPLWKLREHIRIGDTDMSLVTKLGTEDYEDFESEPYTHYLTNTDFTVVTLEKDGVDIMQVVQHKAGEYGLGSINPEIEKMCREMAAKIPSDIIWEYEPTINKECYVNANIVSVSLSLAFSVDGKWSLNEMRASFDLETGKRLTAGDIALLDHPDIDASLAYLSTPMPDNIAESTNACLNQYGTAIIGWGNGQYSAFIERRFINTDLWRNIK